MKQEKIFVPTKKILIITDSFHLRSLWEQVAQGYDLETIWADSLFSAERLLEQTAVAPFTRQPDIILADLGMDEFTEPYLRHQFAQWSERAVVLVVLPENASPSFVDCLRVSDVIRSPLVKWEMHFRLNGALAFIDERAKARYFETAMAETALGCLIFNERGKAIWANHTAENLFGYAEDELNDKTSPLPAEVFESTKKCRKVTNTLKIQRKDGTFFWAACFTTDIDLPEVKGVAVFFHDITDKKLQKDELRLSAKVFEYSGEAIMITDSDDRILKVNDAFTEVTGYPEAEITGKQPDFLNSGRQDDRYYSRMWAVVHSEGHWKGEVWNRRKSGEIIPHWMAVTAVKNSAGELDHYVTILSDITDRLAEEQHLRHLAQHDFLTGLPNRVLLKDRFRQAVANARRHGGILAIVFVDLDSFKAINDRHGHNIGDRLLMKVSERLLAAMRATDTVSRWGGDEFVLLFPEVENDEAVISLTKKVMHGLKAPFLVEGIEITIAASAGISLYPDHGEDLEKLMTHADSAMYAAKNLKDSSFVLFTSNV